MREVKKDYEVKGILVLGEVNDESLLKRQFPNAILIPLPSKLKKIWDSPNFGMLDKHYLTDIKKWMLKRMPLIDLVYLDGYPPYVYHMVDFIREMGYEPIIEVMGRLVYYV